MYPEKLIDAISRFPRMLRGRGENPPPNPAAIKYHALVSAYLLQTGRNYATIRAGHRQTPAGRRILALPGEDKAALALILLERLGQVPNLKWESHLAIHSLLIALIRQNLPFTSAQLVEALQRVTVPGWVYYYAEVPALIRHCQTHVEEHGLSLDLEEALRAFTGSFRSGNQRERKLIRQAKLLLGDRGGEMIEPGEAWADALLTHLNAMDPAGKSKWEGLLLHALKANSTTPSKRWTKQAQENLEGVGQGEFILYALAWLPQVRGKEPKPIPDQASVLLKGLVWTCALIDDRRLPKVLADLALVCFTKIPRIGPRSAKVGNACIRALGQCEQIEAVAELSRLRARIAYRDVQRQIRTALDLAAARAGITPAELEEIAVPEMGVGDDGRVVRRFDGYRAEIRILSAARTKIEWRNPEGKRLKSVPALVRKEHPEELKTLRRQAKDIQKMVSAQRDRIEGSYLLERAWAYPVWFERYIVHPLVAQVARRLIWHFEDGDRSARGIWYQGQIVGVDDQPLDWLGASTIVRLWHPLGFPVEEVQDWRVWLEQRQVTQPFKQAHREIYVITDAEIETRTYSNRFAAHVLRQHQMNQLCRQRGWQFRLMGWWDNHNWPTKHLPGWNLSAEFAVEAVLDEDLLTQAYASLYVTTDQVRFLREGQAVPLSEIPALVLSETMREVDLFVGVCSVGNDPAWQDRGDLPGRAGYWHSYAFGDLSVSAKTRKEVLERLLPRLKIHAVCRLEDKFLVVQGSKRTYKIHLGSGNVLMNPNDQYLCIVPNRSAAARQADEVFLPFEGDKTLSIILSKAFLLAADNKIKDRTILNQINR